MAKHKQSVYQSISSDPVIRKRVDSWIEQLSGTLKPDRFEHSLSVARTAVHLSEKHGLDALRAEQAGLLHDCAKHLSLDEMRQIAVTHSLTSDETILSSRSLLHSVVGAWYAEKYYGMTDFQVLDAIRYHTTGCAGMSRLSMCICLSDSIEPLRESYPLLNRIHELAEQSLEQALLLSLESTAGYVTSRGWFLHPQTQETIRWLKTLPETQEKIILNDKKQLEEKE